MKKSWLICLLMLPAALPALAGPTDAPLAAHIPAKPSPAPAFAQHMLEADRFAAAASRLTLKRSKNEHVRQYAQAMLYHYMKADGQLRAMIAAAHVEAPPPIANLEQQRTLYKLQIIEDDGFNQEYVSTLLSLHKNEATLCRDYVKSGDKTLAHFARQTLPFTRQAQQQAAALRTRLSTR